MGTEGLLPARTGKEGQLLSGDCNSVPYGERPAAGAPKARAPASTGPNPRPGSGAQDDEHRHRGYLVRNDVSPLRLSPRPRCMPPYPRPWLEPDPFRTPRVGLTAHFRSNTSGLSRGQWRRPACGTSPAVRPPLVAVLRRRGASFLDTALRRHPAYHQLIDSRNQPGSVRLRRQMTIDLVFSPELRLSDGTVIKDRNAAIQFVRNHRARSPDAGASKSCICLRARRRRKNSKVRLRDFAAGSPILIATGKRRDANGEYHALSRGRVIRTSGRIRTSNYPGFFLSVARRERCRLSRMTSATSSWKPVSTPSM